MGLPFVLVGFGVQQSLAESQDLAPPYLPVVAPFKVYYLTKVGPLSLAHPFPLSSFSRLIKTFFFIICTQRKLSPFFPPP